MQTKSFTAPENSFFAQILLLVCGAIIGGSLAGCDGGTHLKGIVLDSRDAPVADADVKLTTGELKREVKSSERGIFKIGMTHSPFNPELVLEITKSGFRPFEKRFHANEHIESIVVTLDPLANVQETPSPPFVVSIVPGTGRITMAKNKPREFYVVMTNVSCEPQAVWEAWNSWGYQAISFELTTADGKKFMLSAREQEFSRNGPMTFVVEPGELQVFPIKLDEWWETHPALPKTNDMPIKLKAIYEVRATPQATQYKVWTGRLESRPYNLSLLQW